MTIIQPIFATNIHIRIDDINYGNHLCHTKFINYLHEARALFLKSKNLSEIDCFGYCLFILEISVKYKNQCFFDDKLEIKLFLDKIENASFQLSYIIYNHTTGKVSATATSVMGFIDRTTNKLKKIPNEFIDLIKNEE
ncbi:MAG: acyl-CoA thioesterase [Gammaproteobacteria bacterium]